MVLAAGRGERMRPLTDHTPKPLLAVRGKPLLVHHLDALARAGLAGVVVNTAWLGEQIEARIGPRHTGPDGATLDVHYSREGRDFGGALETAGGIARALPLLADTFWLAGGDVYCPDFAFSTAALQRFAAGDMLAHIVLVPNPPQHPGGDFALCPDGRVTNRGDTMYTYSTLALLRKQLFQGWIEGNPQGLKAPLAPLLRQAADNGRLSGELHTGLWADVGTPQRLHALNAP